MTRPTRLTLAAALALGFAGWGLTAGTAGAATLKFSMDASNYPPFAFKDASGQWKGFEVDLAHAICTHAKLDCEVVGTPWDGIIPALTSKKIDVILASMSITEERQKTIAFSIPYYNTPPEFIGNKDDSFDVKPSALKGKTIGVQVGTIHLNYAQKYYGADNTIKSYQTQDEANADLAAGRLDLVLADSAALDSFLTSDGGSCCDVKGYGDKSDPIFGHGVGAGLRKEDTELKGKIDQAIKDIYASGEFKTLEGKYFKYEIGTPPKS